MTQVAVAELNNEPGVLEAWETGTAGGANITNTPDRRMFLVCENLTSVDLTMYVYYGRRWDDFGGDITVSTTALTEKGSLPIISLAAMPALRPRTT